MRRIAIIGNAGGGKSILARKLGERYNIPVYEFDNLQWQPGWIRTPAEEIASVHRNWLNQSGWLIDGWGSWEILKERFDAADTIILVDYPLWLHYLWATKRQIKAIFKRSTGWPPEGCPALPVTSRLFRLMWIIDKEMLPKLSTLLEDYIGEKQIVHLHSPTETQRWLNENSGQC